MKSLPALFAAALTVLCQPVAADEHPVVVELFTSQGCSSCPPADAVMLELAERPDVIALALHVDYWDYIGWKDAFANPAHAQRQRGYAAAGGRRMIYTPQMIVNGREDLVGVKTMELADLIAHYRSSKPGVEIGVARRGGLAVIHLAPAGAPLDGPFDVQLVRYDPLRTAHITRGENAGRDLDYANVVTGWAVIGQWDGRTEVDFSAPLEGDRPGAVLVQAAHSGPIVAAARFD